MMNNRMRAGLLTTGAMLIAVGGAVFAQTRSGGYGAGKADNLAQTQAVWEAEVNKMIKTYGAPIPEPTAKKITAYLQAHYTPENRKH